MNKALVFLLIAALAGACSQSGSGSQTSVSTGEAVYKKYCVLCHGLDGKLGLNGSKDLTISKLTLEERIIQVTKGKNTMTPFQGILSPEEIKAVAEYTMTLTKQ